MDDQSPLAVVQRREKPVSRVYRVRHLVISLILAWPGGVCAEESGVPRADASAADRIAPTRLVDLEDQVPGRPSFSGRAWQLDRGIVALGGDTLWRLEAPGTPPTPLLRGTSWPAIHDLGDGELVVRGTSLSGRDATWITDGGSPRFVAPAWWSAFAMSWEATLGHRNGVILGKTHHGDLGSFLWRFGERVDIQAVEPSGILGSDDPTALGCVPVLAAPRGFITCNFDDLLNTAILRFGTGGPTEPAPEWRHEPVERGPELDGYRYFIAFTRDEWRDDLLRSDGTAAGTSVVAQDVTRAPVAAWGKAAFLRRVAPTTWEVMVFEGSSTPAPIATVSIEGYPQSMVAVGDWLYILGLAPSSVLAVSEAGTVLQLAEIPAAVASVAAGDDGDTAVLQVRTSNGFETWFANATTGAVEPLPGAVGMDGFILESLPGGALIPWLDDLGYARVGRLAAGGLLEPGDDLTLSGTAGSAYSFLGELEGLAVFYASTVEHGPAVWLSDGTAAGTRPILPSRCERLGEVRPRLDAPDLLVDCLSPGREGTVWQLDPHEVAVPTEMTFPSVHPAGLPPRFVHLGSQLVHLEPGRGIVATEIGTATQVDLIPGCSGRPAATPTHAVVGCGADVWTTDGTVAGTAVLRTTTHYFRSLIEAGGRVVVTGSDSYVTDGTSVGTIAIEPIDGAGSAPPASDAICVWDDSGLSSLDLTSGESMRIRELPLYSVTELPKGPLVANHLLRLRTAAPHGLSLWACDPVAAKAWRVDRYEGDFWSSHGWPGGIHDGEALWRHVVDPTQERLERHAFQRGAWRTAYQRPRALNDESGGYESVRRSPLGIVGSTMWIGWADEEAGREPWLLALPSP